MSDYTVQDLEQQLKPLSSNAFLAFFQKIWRWWLGVWYNFAEKHPKLSKLLYMVFFFIVFSEGVTIIQFIIMTFLPYAFESLWTQSFVWPAVALPWKDAAGNALNYAIFNEPVKFLDAAEKVYLASTAEQVAAYQAAGYSVQIAGLGNFIAFEIAVFLAQCINFPLQRNITYRSHGNPWYQAMWYFIGWVLVSIFTNAVWGIINPLLMWWNWNEVVIGLIKTVLTGGVSMLIFFFIFMVIFPDNNKVAAKKKARYEKLVAAGAPAEKIEAAKAAYEKAQYAADLSNAEKDAHAAASQVNSKVMKYFAHVKKSEKLAADPKDTEEAKAERDQKSQELFDAAAQAIDVKLEKEQAYEEVKAQKDPAPVPAEE